MDGELLAGLDDFPEQPTTEAVGARGNAEEDDRDAEPLGVVVEGETRGGDAAGGLRTAESEQEFT